MAPKRFSQQPGLTSIENRPSSGLGRRLSTSNLAAATLSLQPTASQLTAGVRLGTGHVAGRPSVGSSSTLSAALTVNQLRPSLGSSAYDTKSSASLQVGDRDVETWESWGIEMVQERAMTLDDFGKLRQQIESSIELGEWHCQRSGNLLLLEQVDLYQLNHNHICPSTILDVTLGGLKRRRYSKGQYIQQVDTSNRIVASGIVKVDTSDGNVSVQVSRGKFQLHNEFKVVCHSGKNSTQLSSCGTPTDLKFAASLSYAELVSKGSKCTPKWFCSHWWGEPVLAFIQCCAKHAQLRQTDAPSFWVCAYCNRQHDLGADISDNPEETSFMKALLVADGALLILDMSSTPFSRIWCDFELFQTFTKTGKLFDVATLYEGSVQLLTDGFVKRDFERLERKMQREAMFPLKQLLDGLRCYLEDGHASYEMDKVRILNCMIGNSDLNDDKVLSKIVDDRDKYKLANGILHGRLAACAWSQALEGETLSDCFGLDLLDVLAEDNARRSLSLSFPVLTSTACLDEFLRRAPFVLRPELEELELVFMQCDLDGPRASILAAHLPRRLLKLALRVVYTNLDDEGMEALGAQLPPTLAVLNFDISQCYKVTNAGTSAFVSKLPRQLKETRLDFFEVQAGDDTLTTLAARVSNCLEKFTLYCHGCVDIGNRGVRAVLESLPKRMEWLIMDFRKTKVNADVFQLLAETQVQSFRLSFGEFGPVTSVCELGNLLCNNGSRERQGGGPTLPIGEQLTISQPNSSTGMSERDL